MSFEIEKKVKINAIKYPWEDMVVGDSFFIEKEKGVPIHTTRARVFSHAWIFQKRNPELKKFKIKTKKCTKNGKEGLRVWKIKHES